jgi:serine/threonine protein kinase
MITACPARDEIAIWSVGRCPAARIEEIAEHLDDCEFCTSSLDSLDTTGDDWERSLRARMPDDPILSEPGCQAALARFAGLVIQPPRPGRAERTEAEPTGDAFRAGLELAAGTRLGSYEILGRLGGGGMGVVYRARHTLLKRDVALKVMKGVRLRDPAAVERFRREMESVGKLDHPNVVKAYDADQSMGIHFIAMELVGDTNLSRLVRDRGPLKIADAGEVGRQAAAGLEHAHRLGLVHRDLKPSNLMLTDDGRVKLLDFGLAMLRDSQPHADALTQDGQIMGTADYMAPEQALNPGGVDIRADLYSLGCTLYYVLI